MHVREARLTDNTVDRRPGEDQYLAGGQRSGALTEIKLKFLGQCSSLNEYLREAMSDTIHAVPLQARVLVPYDVESDAFVSAAERNPWTAPLLYISVIIKVQAMSMIHVSCTCAVPGLLKLSFISFAFFQNGLFIMKAMHYPPCLPPDVELSFRKDVVQTIAFQVECQYLQALHCFAFHF